MKNRSIKRFLQFLVFVATLVLPTQAWPALPLQPEELSVGRDFFDGNITVVYLEDLESGRVFTVDAKEVETRHRPFSTFKIPNYLIALETGVAPDSQSIFPYRPERRPRQDFWPADWAQDQTLDSAFKRSAYWVFQEIAVAVGDKTYEGYLDHFKYGNEKASGDSFWLEGPLEISPKEQVDFLRRLLTKQLEVAPLNLQALKKAALWKEKDGFKLYGKTGSGPIKGQSFDGEFEGWYVGWLERPQGQPLLFALWTYGVSYSAIKSYRRDAVVELLDQSGFLPLGW